MLIKHSLRVSGAALLTALVLCLLLLRPLQASALVGRSASPLTAHSNLATSVNANIYLSGDTLKQLFQEQMDSQVPRTVGEIISSTVGQLPSQDQGWAMEMANALLQPSAELLSLKPEANGLLATLKISLYTGDPKPITASILVSFRVMNSTTVQITAKGSGLVSGPLLNFQIPIGSLKAVTAISDCGSADLKVNLQFPLSLSPPATGQTSDVGQGSHALTTPLVARQAGAATDASIEIPAASLAQVGSGLGSIKVTGSFTAQNISMSVESGSLVFNADIYWLGLHIANAVSVMTPGVATGNLIVNVQSTHLEILDNLISIPVDQYDQQIEQLIDAKLNGALTNKFTIAQATIGPDAALPCAAASSLVLSGSIAL
jgi:hypothetical protein